MLRSAGKRTKRNSNAVGMAQGRYDKMRAIMAHSYSANHLHIVFSTLERRKSISEEMRPALWAYMAGVGRKHDLIMHLVGGYQDHAHALISLPATVTLAEAIQTIKAFSSKWMHRQGVCAFQWQEGYGTPSA